MKQTKKQKFRILFPVIVKLLQDYTYEGVLDQLEKDYDLKLKRTTFNAYLRDIRKEEEQKPKIETLKPNDSNQQINQQIINPIVTPPPEKITTNVEFSESKEDDGEELSVLQKALAQFDKSSATRSIKSISQQKEI